MINPFDDTHPPLPIGYVDFRHNNQANVLYVDLHVGSVTAKELLDEYNLPASNPKKAWSWKPRQP